jgi:hypothetical protein
MTKSMKDFMLIFKGPDYSQTGLSAEETQVQMGKWFAWVEKLQKQNIYGGGHALHPTGKTVTDVGTITDGPFAETKELVGGYFIVKAKDLDAAVKLTDDFPDFHLANSVEVREIVVFDN